MKRTLRTGTVWQRFPKYAHLYRVVSTRATNLILDLWGCTRLRHTQANSSLRTYVSFKCTKNNCLTHVQLAHPNPTPQRVSHALHIKVSPVSKRAAAQGSHACGHILCFQTFGSPSGFLHLWTYLGFPDVGQSTQSLCTHSNMQGQ